jgi:hypothetical protein
MSRLEQDVLSMSARTIFTYDEAIVDTNWILASWSATNGHLWYPSGGWVCYKRTCACVLLVCPWRELALCVEASARVLLIWPGYILVYRIMRSVGSGHDRDASYRLFVNLTSDHTGR